MAGAASTGPVADRPGSYAAVRVLLYSHDTFGLGHLRRCLKIADALVRNFQGLSVLLITGSPLVHRYRLPPGVDYVKLPAVRKTGREAYEARSLGTTFDSVLAMRAGLIQEAVRGFSPHVVLVDHSPAGMRGEMLPSLAWLREHLPSTTILLGLRDIIDAPQAVIDQWTRDGIYDLLRHRYDHILVYGSPEVFDTVAAYAFPPDLLAKTCYCHYLAEQTPSRPRGRRVLPKARPLVVVTIGGGDGASDTVVLPYLDMLQARPEPVGFDSVILTGAFMPEALRAELRRRYRHLPVKIQSHITNTRPLLERCDLVVATAGYNTTTEILCHARRALLIPRLLHRQEQYLRARALADRGLVAMLTPGEVTPERLGEVVDSALQSRREPLTEARREGRIPLDGCDRIVEFCHPVLRVYLSQLENLP